MVWVRVRTAAHAPGTRPSPRCFSARAPPRMPARRSALIRSCPGHWQGRGV